MWWWKVQKIQLSQKANCLLYILGCQDCQCSTSGSTSNECNQETGQCNCKPGLIGKKCDKCPPKSIRYVKNDIETPRDFNENQEDCLFCVSQDIESDRPEWLNQFDYDEGCFSCLSIQECKTFEQKECPAACHNYWNQVIFPNADIWNKIFFEYKIILNIKICSNRWVYWQFI